eukprot:m.57891 g.57891  ORF g.57891 m.57891 type:complete len:1941 (-) comp7109_c0_seq1:95-5917(-)
MAPFDPRVCPTALLAVLVVLFVASGCKATLPAAAIPAELQVSVNWTEAQSTTSCGACRAYRARDPIDAASLALTGPEDARRYGAVVAVTRPADAYVILGVFPSAEAPESLREDDALVSLMLTAPNQVMISYRGTLELVMTEPTADVETLVGVSIGSGSDRDVVGDPHRLSFSLNGKIVYTTARPIVLPLYVGVIAQGELLGEARWLTGAQCLGDTSNSTTCAARRRAPCVLGPVCGACLASFSTLLEPSSTFLTTANASCEAVAAFPEMPPSTTTMTTPAVAALEQLWGPPLQPFQGIQQPGSALTNESYASSAVMYSKRVLPTLSEANDEVFGFQVRLFVGSQSGAQAGRIVVALSDADVVSAAQAQTDLPYWQVRFNELRAIVGTTFRTIALLSNGRYADLESLDLAIIIDPVHKHYVFLLDGISVFTINWPTPAPPQLIAGPLLVAASVIGRPNVLMGVSSLVWLAGSEALPCYDPAVQAQCASLNRSPICAGPQRGSCGACLPGFLFRAAVCTAAGALAGSPVQWTPLVNFLHANATTGALFTESAISSRYGAVAFSHRGIFPSHVPFIGMSAASAGIEMTVAELDTEIFFCLTLSGASTTPPQLPTFHDLGYCSFIARDNRVRVYNYGRLLFMYDFVRLGDRIALHVGVSEEDNNPMPIVEFAINNFVFYTIPLALEERDSSKPLVGVTLLNADTATGPIRWLEALSCKQQNLTVCTNLNRLPCFAQETCGPCMPGFDDPLAPESNQTAPGAPFVNGGNTTCQQVQAVPGLPIKWRDAHGLVIIANNTSPSNGSFIAMPDANGNPLNTGAFSTASFTSDNRVSGFSFQLSGPGDAIASLVHRSDAFLAVDDAEYSLRLFQSSDPPKFYIYENGRLVRRAGLPFSYENVFTIRYDQPSNSIQYAIDGIVFYESANPPPFPLSAELAARPPLSSFDAVWVADHNCTSVPTPCATIHRLPCFDDSKCGPCQPGYAASTPAESSTHGNTECVATSAQPNEPVSWGSLFGFIFEQDGALTSNDSVEIPVIYNALGFSGQTLSFDGPARGIEFQAFALEGRSLASVHVGFETQPHSHYLRDLRDGDFVLSLLPSGTVRTAEGFVQNFWGHPVLSNSTHSDTFSIMFNPDTMRFEYAINHRIFAESPNSVPRASFPMTLFVAFANPGGIVRNVVWLGNPACDTAGPQGDGNCTSLFRFPCGSDQTCGPCFYAYIPAVGNAEPSLEANTPCVLNEAEPETPVEFLGEFGQIATAAGKVSVPNHPLTSISWGSSGAVSSAAFRQNASVIGVSWTVRFGGDLMSASTMQAIIGLATLPRELNSDFVEIDFATQIFRGLLLFRLEGRQSGSGPNQLIRPSDTLGIRVNQDTGFVEHFINRRVLWTEESQIPRYPLLFDTAMNTIDTGLDNITWLNWTTCRLASRCNQDAHRYACFAENLCESCLPGYTGSAAPSNDVCTQAHASSGPVLWGHFFGDFDTLPGGGIASAAPSTNPQLAMQASSMYALTNCSQASGVAFRIKTLCGQMTVSLRSNPDGNFRASSGAAFRFTLLDSENKTLVETMQDAIITSSVEENAFEPEASRFELFLNRETDSIELKRNGVVLAIESFVSLPLVIEFVPQGQDCALRDVQWFTEPALVHERCPSKQNNNDDDDGGDGKIPGGGIVGIVMGLLLILLLLGLLWRRRQQSKSTAEGPKRDPLVAHNPLFIAPNAAGSGVMANPHYDSTVHVAGAAAAGEARPVKRLTENLAYGGASSSDNQHVYDDAPEQTSFMSNASQEQLPDYETPRFQGDVVPGKCTSKNGEDNYFVPGTIPPGEDEYIVPVDDTGPGYYEPILARDMDEDQYMLPNNSNKQPQQSSAQQYDHLSDHGRSSGEVSVYDHLSSTSVSSDVQSASSSCDRLARDSSRSQTGMRNVYNHLSSPHNYEQVELEDEPPAPTAEYLEVLDH